MAANDMCGPSNALKGLTRHVESDRSLQQNRITSGAAGPHQVRDAPAAVKNEHRLTSEQLPFRTNHAHNTNDQFAAFQNGQGMPAPMGPPMMPQMPLQPASGMTASRPPQANGFGNWAQEFERLSLGGGAAPGPSGSMMATPNQHNVAHHPHNFHSAPRMPSPMQSSGFNYQPMHMPQMAPQPMGGFGQYDHFAMQHHERPQMSSHMHSQPGPHSFALDAETKDSFETEFANEMNQWMAQNGPSAQESIETALQSGFDAVNAPEIPAETPRPDDAKNPPDQRQPSADPQLARAARQVADAVADNKNEKFKNSHFFNLMRRVGDNQVILNGEKFVEAADGQSPAASGSNDTAAVPDATA